MAIPPSDSVDDRQARLQQLAATIRRERDAVVCLIDRDPHQTAEIALNAMLASPTGPLHHAAPSSGIGAARTHYPAVADLEEIDLAGARRLMTTILQLSLAYGVEVLPQARAEELANAILAVVGPATRWWTNGDLGLASPGSRLLWTPLTAATFDTGVLGVDHDVILVVWIMEED